MASISSVITGGFGVPGSASLVITDGFGTAGVYIPPVVISTGGGVRKSRYLRRASKDVYKLPWEREDDPKVVVAPVRRKRIPLPVVEEIREAVAPVPIQTIREISAPRISIQDVGVAVLDDDDEDLLLWLM